MDESELIEQLDLLLQRQWLYEVAAAQVSKSLPPLLADESAKISLNAARKLAIAGWIAGAKWQEKYSADSATQDQGR